MHRRHGEKMTVEVFQNDGRMREAASELCGRELPFDKIYILPIPSTRDGVHISGTDTELLGFAEKINGKTAVIGYGIPNGIKEKLVGSGAALYDAKDDERFTCENAHLTVIGALPEIITARKTSVEDTSFGVIGYGRIGAELVRVLLSLGTYPVVFSGRSEIVKELASVGIHAVLGYPEEELYAIDVLINTAPTSITDKEGCLRITRSGTVIFDLASGENFGGSEDVIRLPAVPTRVYPISAGRAVVRGFIRSLDTKNDNGV